MNVLPTKAQIRSPSSSQSNVIHDKDIYHEMMKEMGMTSSCLVEDPNALYFSNSYHSKKSSHHSTLHEYEDYDDDDESDFAAGNDDHDIDLVYKELDLSKDLIFRKDKDDATEVTAADTDVSLNCSSWHSSTSQRSGYSATSSSYLRRSRHGSRSTRHLQSPDDSSSIHVFEDPNQPCESTSEAICLVENVNCLQSHGLLGEGFFGQVFLVSAQHPSVETSNCQSNDTHYALKRLSKYHLLCEDQIHTVLREREILKYCHYHPGIVTLYQTFQDDAHLYLLQSYIPGGELFTLLHNPRFTLTEGHAQFYTACIADALWYLHCSETRPSIVYRDLKPENVMLDAQGYPILIDFGYAKCLTHPDDDHRAGCDLKSRRTYTLCGTSKYLSPEMIDGQGHGGPTDYWSLGIVVYELLSQGEHPFEFYPQMDDRSLFHAIAEADYLPLPEEGISDVGLDFVDQLLIKAPQHRLGSDETTAFNPILQHPWLRSWNVDELRQQLYPAPWVPNSAGSDKSVAPTSMEDSSSRSSQSGGSIPLLHSEVDSHLTRREQALFADF